MKRAFLSLYLLIVLATLGLGWALDQLWSAYQAEHPTQAPGAVLTSVLQHSSAGRPLDQTRALIHRLASEGQADVRLAPLSDISGESIKARLEAGESLSFEDANGNLYHYGKLADHPQVIIIGEVTPDASRRFEALLAVLFYGALAAVVFFWLWPLTRDLNRLEQQAEALGRNPETAVMELQGHSAAQRLAQAFNQMARRIRDLLRSQREMTHAVSHELRTPLARMKFALEMADANSDPQTLRTRLQSLRADVAEMDQLVNQLLHYARFEQQPSLHLTPGDMPGLLQDLWHRLSGHLDHPPRLYLHTAAHPPPVVCDWPLMERALHNLLQNALRYARRRVDITLTTAADETQVQIEDDGPGIPEEERERIFESFVRLREAPELHSAGFGLGLAIVHRVMQWHHGTVRVDTATTGGARFTLRWPSEPHTGQ
ncbi:ATP-binding protein [Marinimicrobium sp. C6131]|uniref:ATP-binding protein n=1 Tax=Marinimicrobium sp. C6131 TaxID=3022676 RepID=UPI00223E119D|nr:ATP-binding protein [Marinimicrobium sp. C6131]UZJ44571.1 ATP-binding protein [Marinimicrobium sp. C6131]